MTSSLASCVCDSLRYGSTRELGRSTRLDVRDLAPGTWELTFTGTDPDDANLKASAKVTVTVTGTVTASTTTTTTPDSTTTASTPVNGGIVGSIPGQ